MNTVDYGLGDIVEMKKPHPCKKSKEFRIIRMGADIRIKCLGCQTSILMSRQDFNRKIKRVVQKAEPVKEED